VDGFAVHAFNLRRHGYDVSNVAYHRVGSAGVLAALPLLVDLPTLQKKRAGSRTARFFYVDRRIISAPAPT
jgi:hypothetical protein